MILDPTATSRAGNSGDKKGDVVYTTLDRDLVLSEQDLDRIIVLIQRMAGIVLARHKHGMVYGRLSRRIRELGLSRFSDYLDRVEREEDGREGEIFVNALTTNLTAFFREAHHFDILARHLRGRKGPVRIWTNAASTGEEAYSIAITARQVLGDGADIHILATDVDTAALKTAERGVYPLTQVVKHADRDVTRYFLKGQGTRDKQARVRPELAAMIEFSPLNLMERLWYTPGAPFDAIFCRNVMIYFSKETQARILERFVPLLKADGLLFAGHSESFTYISKAFQLQGKTVYTLAGARPR